ncbi:MAG: IS3 family transposase [Clostridiales bacterium]|nr:IS3 family transposase [Clostridiales bacterium]
MPFHTSFVAEDRINRTLKKEQIYKRKYDTMKKVRRDMFEYIELFYNRKCKHSYLGYMSPVEYR